MQAPENGNGPNPSLKQKFAWQNHHFNLSTFLAGVPEGQTVPPLGTSAGGRQENDTLVWSKQPSRDCFTSK